jgi:hypothetical protein
MGPDTRRRAALAVMAAAALAVMATSQRRWTLSHAPLSGSATIPAGSISADQRVALRLTPAEAFHGKHVRLMLTVATSQREPTAVRVSPIVRAESEPWTLPSQGDHDRPVLAEFARACAPGAPCDANFTVRWTRDPASVATAVTVRWTLTPEARGVGEDPVGSLVASPSP